MDRLSQFVGTHWFGLLLLAIGAFLGVLSVWGPSRRKSPSFPLLLAGAAFGLTGLGGLLLPSEFGLWLGGAALGVLFCMLLVVIVTGNWWAPLGYGMGAILLLGLGAACTELASFGLGELGRVIVSLEPTQPWWLLLLLTVPAIIALSFRSLAGLGPVR